MFYFFKNFYSKYINYDFMIKNYLLKQQILKYHIQILKQKIY